MHVHICAPKLDDFPEEAWPLIGNAFLDRCGGMQSLASLGRRTTGSIRPNTSHALPVATRLSRPPSSTALSQLSLGRLHLLHSNNTAFQGLLIRRQSRLMPIVFEGFHHHFSVDLAGGNSQSRICHHQPNRGATFGRSAPQAPTPVSRNCAASWSCITLLKDPSYIYIYTYA